MVVLHLACDLMLNVFIGYFKYNWHGMWSNVVIYNQKVFKTQVFDGWSTFGMWSNVAQDL